MRHSGRFRGTIKSRRSRASSTRPETASGAFINARREGSDYSDGWPDRADLPERLLPAMAGTETFRAPVQKREKSARLADQASEPPAPRFSECFRAFMDDRGVGPDEKRGIGWTVNTTRQAGIALEKFLSLIGDLPVDRITSGTAEKLRAKLKEMPNLYGKTIYAGLSAEQRAGIDEDCEPVRDIPTGGRHPVRPIRPARRTAPCPELVCFRISAD